MNFLIVSTWLVAMKNKDKDKIKMATCKTEHLTANESTSRKEVGVQDSTCTTVLTAS